MSLFSLLFSNPVSKILEERLWEAARKRYLEGHPEAVSGDARKVWALVKTAYKDSVAAALKEGDEKVRAKWGQFKHEMTRQLKVALTAVLQVSDVKSYSVEVGALPYPQVIAAPCQLLKLRTADVMALLLKKKIDFENLDDETLQAMAIYAADRRFEEVLEDARRARERFKIGGDPFAVVEVIQRDAYYLGPTAIPTDAKEHHSLIDMVIFHSANDPATLKAAVKKWLDQGRKNRRDDRRFTGEGWDIPPEELKSWSTEP